MTNGKENAQMLAVAHTTGTWHAHSPEMVPEPGHEPVLDKPKPACVVNKSWQGDEGEGSYSRQADNHLHVCQRMVLSGGSSRGGAGMLEHKLRVTLLICAPASALSPSLREWAPDWARAIGLAQRQTGTPECTVIAQDALSPVPWAAACLDTHPGVLFGLVLAQVKVPDGPVAD